jgi:hypothetical protein
MDMKYFMFGLIQFDPIQLLDFVVTLPFVEQRNVHTVVCHRVVTN